MSSSEDNASPSSVSANGTFDQSSQNTIHRSQQWLEAKNKNNDNPIVEFSDDEEYELTRLTPSIEKAIRLSILSIGQDSDLDFGDDFNKKAKKQKRKRDDEMSLNKYQNRIPSIINENSMETDNIANTSYNILEPVTKKIRLEELDVPQPLQDKCTEILNNSQEIKDFLDEKPNDRCHKILKVKLFKPDQKMQLMINNALKKIKTDNYLLKYLENKENIGINNGSMIKSEPIDLTMQVDFTSQPNNPDFVNYEFLETTYSPESMVEDTVAIATRNDEPMEDSDINVEKVKQENDDTNDLDSLPSAYSRYELSSNLTPASSDVEMNEVDNRSDVIVREPSISQKNLFDDCESSCISISGDDSDSDDESRFSDYKEQADSVLFPRPTTSHSNRDLGDQALETLQRQQELTMDRLQDLHGSLVSRPLDTDHVEDPSGLFTPLMLHQQQALAWLLWREKQKPPGGILADDMGLGKTLTMISLVLARYTETQRKKKRKIQRGRSVKPRGGTLVVCPASLLAQWQNEIFDHCKPQTLTVGIYHGNKREQSVKKLAKKDIIITTYSILAHGIRQYGKNPLFKIHWDRLVLDEAHVIRNHKTRMCEAVCELVTDSRWALTGTPIHNKQMDLYSILKFLRCSPFDDLKIWRRWVDNKDEAGYRRLTTLMKTLMLRRTKKELIAKKLIQPLPAKLSQIIPIELDPDERVVYEKVMIYSRTLFGQFLHQRAEKKRQMDLGVGYYRPTEDCLYYQEFNDAQKMLLATHADIQSTDIFVLLTRLRQICCHPSLIHAMLDREDVQQSAHNNPILNFDLLNKINTFQEPPASSQAGSTSDEVTNEIKIENLDEEEIGISKRVTENLLTRTNPVFNKTRISSKHRAMLERIKEIIQNGNDKIVVVSQWTSHLKIIAENLKLIEGATFKSFDGSIAVQHRQKIVNELNTPDQDPRILLLSLTVGGVGLNLVGANHLMLADIHWNPQLETQAQDRIYRFGQKKPVHIYRYICSDSIEERIKNLQEYKLDIAQNILTGTGRVSTNLTLDDLKTLFGFA